jgi:hypothetical protein
MTENFINDNEQNPLISLTNNLPFPIALIIKEYVTEENPFVKLHRMTDAAELLTRFLTGVLFSDLLRQLGLFPQALCKALTDAKHSQRRSSVLLLARGRIYLFSPAKACQNGTGGANAL